MTGKCYSCANSFSVFKKELSCKNCGFSFCKNCLHQKIKVPKCKNEVHQVCNKCYDILSGKTTETKQVVPPPDSHVKRMAALNKGRDKDASTSTGQSRSSHPKDEELSRRLGKLKAHRKHKAHKEHVPSQQELEERVRKLGSNSEAAPSQEELRQKLSRLRGEVVHEEDMGEEDGKGASLSQFNLQTQVDGRSHQQQVDDLLENIADEVRLEQQTGQNNLNKDHHTEDGEYTPNVTFPPGTEPEQASLPATAMAGRQAKAETRRVMDELKADTALMPGDSKKRSTGIPARQNISLDDNEAYLTYDDNIEDDEEESEMDEIEANKLINQIVAENALEDKIENVGMRTSTTKKANLSPSHSPHLGNTDDEEELPWCCICTNDAVLRCRGCDNDLYCKRCFKEAHDRLDKEHHVTIKFVPKAEKNE